MDTPKTRWRNWPRTTTVNISDLSSTVRMDADFYLARDCLNKILEELRHNTAPSLETFMSCVDFVLDHTAAVTTLTAAYPKPTKGK